MSQKLRRWIFFSGLLLQGVLVGEALPWHLYGHVGGIFGGTLWVDEIFELNFWLKLRSLRCFPIDVDAHDLF